MAALLLFLLFSTANAAQQRSTNITLGSSLTPTKNSSWLSPSGLYAFGFVPQSNGYVVAIFAAGIPDKTVVWTWTAPNGDPTVANNVVLQLTLDGRLILQQSEGRVVYVVDSSQPLASASMLDNGNFVLYDSDSRIIWQSFNHCTNTLLPDQHLPNGGELFSSASKSDFSRGIFRLKMQPDGNLVQYPVNTPDTGTYAYWSTGTFNQGNNVSLILENDGYLYLFNGSSVVRNITRGYQIPRTIFLMRIDVDGIIRLYSHSIDRGANWTTRWSSSDDLCTPKGLCGVNGFCVLLDNVAVCRCLPGFDFVQSGNWTAGCTRNFTAEVCGNKDHGAKFEIRQVENTEWEDNSYDGLNTNAEEECRQACLDDCNCEVAFFNGRRCSKQKLPLRYGSRRLSESTVALVKVSTSAPDTTISGNSGVKVEKTVRLDILIVSISLLALAFLAMATSWIYARRVRAFLRNYKMISEVTLVEDVGLRAFTYVDLAKATNDFQEELGRGASGTVYKGVLQNSQKVVAVKRLEKAEFAQGEREFQTEVKTIGRTYHRNLVRLLGYSLDGPSKLLVFEYMSNGSLADILFKHDEQLSWTERVELARDIARGILYLHEECETQIIHCDIKPQNILMDEKGCAKISDFGLAKLLKQDETKTYTGIRGTKGYVAPEWHQRQPVTVKADVYSYGIVLLEIICNRKSVQWDLPENEAILEEWVYECYETGELSKLVMSNEIFDQRKLERMVKIGIWCIQDEPSLRPSMKKVLLMLEGTVEIPVPPNPTSFLSSL